MRGSPPWRDALCLATVALAKEARVRAAGVSLFHVILSALLQSSKPIADRNVCATFPGNAFKPIIPAFQYSSIPPLHHSIHVTGNVK